MLSDAEVEELDGDVDFEDDETTPLRQSMLEVLLEISILTEKPQWKQNETKIIGQIQRVANSVHGLEQDIQLLAKESESVDQLVDADPARAEQNVSALEVTFFCYFNVLRL